jgi:1,4-alpha-glucan branching enzyme
MPATPSGPSFDPRAWRAILEGRHADPGSILGPRVVPHDSGDAMLARHVRTFQPTAARAWLVQAAGGMRRSVPMRRTHPAGIFEGVVDASSSDSSPGYTIRVETRDGRHEIHDPYAFPPMLTDFDIHLLV